MAFKFTVSPDFSPERLAGWYVFNTYLQRKLQIAIHLEIYPDFTSQREAIKADKVDLIYANPYDASMLIREKGFFSLARPEGKSDEAVIAVAADRGIGRVEDLTPGISVATTADPDVHMMGMIMLEPANLNSDNVNLQVCESYVLVAKQLLKGRCDVGIFLAEAFHDLSALVKNRLRVLVSSEIQVIHHSLMLGPALSRYREPLCEVLLAMPEDEKGRSVLSLLGFPAWVAVDGETTEFMIDLMDTLLV